MNFVLEDISKLRTHYPAADDPDVQARMLTLPKYLDLACRMIASFAPSAIRSQMLSSEDAIAYVANKIMRGDWCYDPKYAAKKMKGIEQPTIGTFRGYMAKRAIGQYMKKMGKMKGKFEYLDEMCINPSVSQIDEIALREDRQQSANYARTLLSNLTEVQRQCITMHYLQGISPSDIADQMGISRQAVQKNIKRGIEGLQRAAGKIK